MKQIKGLAIQFDKTCHQQNDSFENISGAQIPGSGLIVNIMDRIGRVFDQNNLDAIVKARDEIIKTDPSLIDNSARWTCLGEDVPSSQSSEVNMPLSTKGISTIDGPISTFQNEEMPYQYFNGTDWINLEENQSRNYVNNNTPFPMY